MHQLYHGEPPSRANDMPPHSWLKAVGPMGWPADQGGRPNCWWRPPPPTAGVGLVWAWPYLNTGIELLLSGFALVLGLHFVQLSLNRCSDIFCDFMSGQSVLATCILAQKHILHFLEGEVWFRDLFG